MSVPKKVALIGRPLPTFYPKRGPHRPRIVAATFDGTAEAVPKNGWIFGIPRKRLG
jgi:hypothetical protein